MSVQEKNSKVQIGKIKTLWKENDLYLGIPIIDLHHIWLIYLILVLENDMALGKFESESYNFHNISSELINFTINHFAVEEELFHKYKYPITQDHINQHVLFVNYIKENTVVGKLKNRNVVEETILFLKNWLFEHIHEEDTNYNKYFKSKDIDVNEFVIKLIEREIVKIKTTDKQIQLYKIVTGLPFEFHVQSKDVATEVIKFWKTFKLGIGIPILNMQNLWLLNLVIELEYSLDDPSPIMRKAAIVKLFKELDIYFYEHFLVEESIMRVMSYPDKIEHIKKHESIKDLIKLRKSQMEDRQLGRNLVVDLKNWLVSHIGFEDKTFKKIYLKNQKKVQEYVKQNIIDKKFVIHPHQLNLYSVIKVMLESDAEG